MKFVFSTGHRDSSNFLSYKEAKEMATITITYTKPVDSAAVPANQICATFVPTNAAADNPVFASYDAPDNYYDTNVDGYGAGMTPEEFFNKQVAHPGLIAALRAAMRAGSYDWEATDADVQYVGEIAPALEDQGFEFSTGSSQG